MSFANAHTATQNLSVSDVDTVRSTREDSTSRNSFSNSYFVNIDYLVEDYTIFQTHRGLPIGRNSKKINHNFAPLHNTEYGNTTTGRRRSMFVGRTASFRKPK